MSTSTASTFAGLMLVLAGCSDAADPAVDASHARDVGGDAAGSADAPSPVDAGPLRTLVLNEVVAAGSPDWIEVVNATTSPLELSDFIYVDAAGNFTKAVAFPAMTLAAGAYYAQDVDDATSGFALGSDEEVWIYRGSDHALSDGVDWSAGDSPAGGSYARIPDVFGPFTTTSNPTKGSANSN